MQKLFVRYFFGIILTVLLIGACKPTEAPISPEGRISLKFRAVYDGVPVQMENKYEPFIHYGDSIYFKKFRFFISNVALEGQTTRDLTQIIPNDDVALIDLSDLRDFEPAFLGKFLTPRPAQLGEYKGLRIDFGVPPDLNVEEFDPNLYGGDHVLDNSQNHSTDLSSYVFLEITGETLNSDTPFRYRVGANEMFKEGLPFLSFVMIEDEDQIVNFHFVVDLKKVLDDFRVSKYVGDLSDNTLRSKLMNNFINAIELE